METTILKLQKFLSSGPQISNGFEQPSVNLFELKPAFCALQAIRWDGENRRNPSMYPSLFFPPSLQPSFQGCLGVHTCVRSACRLGAQLSWNPVTFILCLLLHLHTLVPNFSFKTTRIDPARVGAVKKGASLKDGGAEGGLELVEGGRSQRRAAAADEAQRRRPLLRIVAPRPRQQYLRPAPSALLSYPLSSSSSAHASPRARVPCAI